MNPQSYTVLDLDKNWERIVPYCYDVENQKILNECIREWISSNKKQWGHLLKEWNVVEAFKRKQPAPWEFTSSDYWCNKIDEDIQKQVEEDNPLACAAHHGQMLSYCLYELGKTALISKSESTVLHKVIHRLQKQFEPTEFMPQWWVPRHSCHDMAPFNLALACSAYPDGEWTIVYGELHSTVVDTRYKRVFDLLLWNYLEFDGEHPFAFALQEEAA